MNKFRWVNNYTSLPDIQHSFRIAGFFQLTLLLNDMTNWKTQSSRTQACLVRYYIISWLKSLSCQSKSMCLKTLVTLEELVRLLNLAIRSIIWAGANQVWRNIAPTNRSCATDNRKGSSHWKPQRSKCKLKCWGWNYIRINNTQHCINMAWNSTGQFIFQRNMMLDPQIC